MSFDDFEQSNYDGQPIALYEFTLGTKKWHYSSDEVDTILPGSPDPIVFTATAISDSGLVQSGDGNNNEMVVTLPSSTEIAQVFSTTPPSDEIWLTIRRKQRADDDAPVMWVGTLSSSKQTNLRTTQFNCQLLSATFNRNGLRLSWGRQCPHALYDRNCKVNKNLFATAFTVASLSGNVINAPALGAYPTAYFSNGFFEFTMISGAIERRAIEHHFGTQLSILGTSEGLTVGAFIMAYPGCARHTQECNSKFNNLVNFGGYPHMPGKSPFNGLSPIF